MKNFRIHVKYEEEEIEIIFLVISIFLILLSYNFISKRKYVLLTVVILDEMIIGLFTLQTLLALFAFSTCAFFNFNARIYFSNNITLSTKILGDFKRCEQI